MSDTEEIVVNVEDEQQETTTETPDPVAELSAQLEQYKKDQEKTAADLEATRQREAEVRRQADTLAREATQARSEASDSHIERVMSEVSTAEIEADSGVSEYAQAMEKGDFIAAAKAQRKIAGAEAKIVRLNEAKAYLEQVRNQPPPPQRQNVDPIEQYVQNRAPQTQQWLREHRDWVLDPTKNAQLTRAHYSALGEGLTVDTPDYFHHVETKIGLRQPPQERQRDDQGRFVAEQQRQQQAASQQRRPSAPPSAPVNGGGAPGMSGSNTTTITLTKREADAAKDGSIVWKKNDLAAGRIKDATLIGQPIGQTEFARRKKIMMEAGAYDKGS